MTREEQAKEVWHKAFENLVDDMRGLTREQLASGFFELGWRAADENPPKGTSLIKWQTGEPDRQGLYLISVRRNQYCGIMQVYYTRGLWLLDTNTEISKERVLAWCNLNDVEPYKE